MNKPVAYRHWMIDEEFPEDSCWEYFDAPTGEDCLDCIPLYTHPVKEQDTDCQYCKQGCIRCDARKQLTDEEIEELAMEYLENTGKGIVGVYDFARAILRKAQEK